MDSSFGPIKVGSLRARVAEALRAAIFAGRLKPGDALREIHLAREFHVSQATVREALLQLEYAGLVVRNPNRDTTVTRMAPEEMRERAHLRAVLEAMAGVEAARFMQEADFQALQSRVDAMTAAQQAGDYFRFSAADLEFHRAIWGYSRNRTLCRTLEQLTVPLFAFLSIRRSARFPEISSSIRPHQPILDALAGRREDTIRAVFRDHILGSYERLAALPEVPPAGSDVK